MKQSIQWHERCLASMEQALRAKIEQRAALEREIAKLGHTCQYYAQQIGKARALGKDGFDEDRFKP